MHCDARCLLRQHRRMDADDDQFLDAVAAIVLDILQRLGNDPQPRFRFLRRG